MHLYYIVLFDLTITKLLSNVVERQLAQVKKDRISAVYNHSIHLDKRKIMMDFGSNYVVSNGSISGHFLIMLRDHEFRVKFRKI